MNSLGKYHCKFCLRTFLRKSYNVAVRCKCSKMAYLVHIVTEVEEE